MNNETNMVRKVLYVFDDGSQVVIPYCVKVEIDNEFDKLFNKNPYINTNSLISAMIKQYEKTGSIIINTTD